MKNKLDKNISSIKEKSKKPYSWAKGFNIGGRIVHHPYTLSEENKHSNVYQT